MGNLEAVECLTARRPYVGRFAPSPTGDMHFGIARTSLIAWLDARAHDGEIRLRIEDIDGPRCVPGSAEGLKQDLMWLGLDWDGPISFQSQRTHKYEAAIEKLSQIQRVYPCTCSRKDIRTASAPHELDNKNPRYPGTCRSGPQPRAGRNPSYRLRTKSNDHIFHQDRAAGTIRQDIEQVVGDFVLRRSDGLWAYQLAVVVDDLDQGITSIVRGDDLIDSTPRQLLLRQLLAPQADPIETLHVPLMRGMDGRRLAKRDQSYTIASARREGRKAASIIGELAASLKIIPVMAACTPTELIPAWKSLLQ